MTLISFVSRFQPCSFIAIFTLTGLIADMHAEQIPMTPERWPAPPGKVEFLQHHGAQALRVLPGAGQVVLNNLDFGNGTIEIDVLPERPDFVSFFFRRQSSDENEIVYLRSANVGKPAAPDTLQYAPTVKAANLWDLLGHYQAPCALRSNDWNHIKLVVSGAQMRVFVNDSQRTVLEVPRLEGNTTTGRLALGGSAYFANLQVRNDEVEGLPTLEGVDPTHNDQRYLRRWSVSLPMPLPPGREPFKGDLPRPDTTWESISAERHGLINLTRLFGKSESRRMVWLKLKLRAASAMKRRMEFGFSDEVWIFLNGGLAYADKNLYGQPVMKPPQGRCSIENTSFTLPLKAGENVLLIGVANDFFGWGIVARLESMDGIEILDR